MLAMAAPFARWTTMQSLPTCACARQRSLLRRSLASRSHRLRTSLMASSHPLPLLWTSRPVRTPSARRGPSVRCYALRRPWPRPFWSAWVARLPASLSRRASAADVPAAGGSGRAWLRQRKRTPGRLWRRRNRRRAGGHLGELCRRQLSGRASRGALTRAGRPTRAGPHGTCWWSSGRTLSPASFRADLAAGETSHTPVTDAQAASRPCVPLAVAVFLICALPTEVPVPSWRWRPAQPSASVPDPVPPQVTRLQLRARALLNLAALSRWQGLVRVADGGLQGRALSAAALALRSSGSGLGGISSPTGPWTGPTRRWNRRRRALFAGVRVGEASNPGPRLSEL
mmetsp:Transcript_4071/g.11801  ORF Transcript_4071/g.11801 Transcript_4071/m.11801 type:complete len:342 (-) Transcript_4071:17-1042(-)